MKLVTPETWYRLFWLAWSIGILLAARWFLVQPILDALSKLKR